MKRFLQCLLIISLPFYNAYAQDEAPEGMVDFASSRKYSLFSEGLPLPNSPEAFSMIQYSSPQANLYRGEISIEIPFYTYSDDDFEIPISFSYRSGGYKPNVPYGVMGLGWSLNAGGFISREVRGLLDETAAPTNKDMYKLTNKLYGDNDRDVAFPEPDMYGYAYWFKADTTDNKGYYHLDCVLDFKVGAEFMPTLSPNVDSDDVFYKHIETTPDVFHFNVPGHSGSFVFDSYGKAIFFDTSGAAAYYKLEAYFNNSFIESFTITSDDKYVYYFDVVETSSSFNIRFSDDSYPISNTWKLRSIKAPNGRMVQYTYGLPYTTGADVPFKVDETYTRHLKSAQGGSAEGTYEYLDMRNEHPTRNTNENYPLKSIMIDNSVQISFDYLPQSSQRGASCYGKNLMSVAVKNLGETKLSCGFSYHNEGHVGEGYSSTIPGVTYLDSIKLQDRGVYCFEYNEPAEPMPSTDTYAIDWYGFYNGSTNKNTFLPNRSTAKNSDAFLLNLRQPSFERTKYGMLTKIIYPTGGWTTFTYERNDYSTDYLNTVADLNLEPDGIDHYGAGIRLKSMSDYDSDGAAFRQTDYKYINKDGKSSGCLLWRPIIYSNYSVRTTNIRDLDRETVSSANDFTYSGRPHIEYLRVLEEVYDPETPQKKGITEYTYHTSYHMTARDSYDVGVNWTIPNWEYVYSPSENLRYATWIQSNEQSRLGGRLLTRTTYADNLDTPITKDSLTYDVYYPETNSSLETYTVVLGFKSKLFYTFSSVISDNKYEYTYDKNGDLITSKFTDSGYDAKGRLVRTTQTDSRGRTITTKLSYHESMPTLITDRVTSMDGNIIRAERYNYMRPNKLSTPNQYVPASMKLAIIDGEVPDTSGMAYKTKISFDKYDDKGRLLQSTDERGVKTSYVWGYDGRYLIAAVEGVSYQELKNNPNLRNYSELFGTNGRYYPSGIPSVVESKLRNLPGVLVTTWEHDPLVGVTKCTDPSGRIYTYSYDDHNRLAESTLNGNTVLMQYLYNIVSQNNNLIQP